jgi:hypothetical protein
MGELVPSGYPHQCGAGRLTKREKHRPFKCALRPEGGERSVDALVVASPEVAGDKVTLLYLLARDGGGCLPCATNEMADQGAHVP